MPRTTDAKTRILESALDLFHAQGVSATGVDQILAASKTGKSQFYHYFQDKDDLVVAVMRHFAAKVSSGEIPVKHELATLKDLEDWFAFFLDAQSSMECARSCPIGTIAGELRTANGPIRDAAREIFRNARVPLIQLFETLRAKGQLRRSVDPNELADFCFTIMQGGMLVGKVERDPAAFRHAARHAVAYIRALRP